MKKVIFLTIGCCMSLIVSSQINSGNISGNGLQEGTAGSSDSVISNDYSAVDAYALSLKTDYKDVYELAAALTGNYKTDAEKVRAIYRWITENIAYDCKDYHRGVNTSQRIRAKHKYDENDFRYYFANRVIQEEKAVCEGYAVLFSELCKISGVGCMIVEGAADNNTQRIEFYRNTYYYYPNHAWNKVLVNKKWYYIDATWSSGSCNTRITQFFKGFNDHYFLTPADRLYNTHVANKYGVTTLH